MSLAPVALCLVGLPGTRDALDSLRQLVVEPLHADVFLVGSRWPNYVMEEFMAFSDNVGIQWRDADLISIRQFMERPTSVCLPFYTTNWASKSLKTWRRAHAV